MNSKWRPKNWERIKQDAIGSHTENVLDSIIEAASIALLEAYFNSDEFGEDASEYCRCQGWEEPR